MYCELECDASCYSGIPTDSGTMLARCCNMVCFLEFSLTSLYLTLGLVIRTGSALSRFRGLRINFWEEVKKKYQLTSTKM